jgi:surface antigen
MTRLMSARLFRSRIWFFGIALFLANACGGSAAFAHTRHHSSHHSGNHSGTQHLASRHVHSRHMVASRRHHSAVRYARLNLRHRRYASAHYLHSGLQCVPYAREVSHIELSGNAFLWWAEASGRYARGQTPVQGAVLNFRAIGRMPLGHVAVVTAVIDSRTILVTQANWIRGTITNDVTMQDVSSNNDWSQVQVELGDTSTWGAAYPTYGFIYNRPDSGTVIANSDATQGNEVAEAPRAVAIQTDAPDRNLQ